MALQFPHSKDPASDLDYICDWSEWLGSDTIDTSTWDVPAELTDGGNSHNGKVTTIWLSDGESGETYILTNKIITTGLRTAERDIKLKVKNR